MADTNLAQLTQEEIDPDDCVQDLEEVVSAAEDMVDAKKKASLLLKSCTVKEAADVVEKLTSTVTDDLPLQQAASG